VIQFETPVIEDSLCIIGYPKMKLFVSSEVEGGGPTDTDFFVRILDVYPDGRTFFVSEGAINGRAREYARSIAQGSPNDQAAYSNLQSGQIYELEFKMMPIAYTFGSQHQIKILISSSNYPRYQCNPNLPIEEGEFFRRDVGDGQSYEFEGVPMNPRIALQSLYFGVNNMSQMILPVFTGDETGFAEQDIQNNPSKLWPNPTQKTVSLEFITEGIHEVHIRSINGPLVFRKTFHQKQGILDMSPYSAGIYFLEVTNENKEKEIHKLIYQP